MPSKAEGAGYLIGHLHRGGGTGGVGTLPNGAQGADCAGCAVQVTQTQGVPCPAQQAVAAAGMDRQQARRSAQAGRNDAHSCRKRTSRGDLEAGFWC